MKIKLAIFALILGVMAASQAIASPIVISLDTANQTGSVGETLVFFGTIPDQKSAVLRSAPAVAQYRNFGLGKP